MKLSIIIPVYNEEQLIGQVIERIKNVTLSEGIIKEIIIINDGSTDSILKVLKKYAADPEIKIFNQDINMGKTQAVRLGLEKSRGDIILIQDADLEYHPKDYPKLLEPFIKDKASVVYGSRFKGAIERMPFINKIANIVSNITCNLLFNTQLTDIHTCYKVFKKEVFNTIKITSENFVFDMEITAKILKKEYKIHEIPIHYIARSKKEGKKISWGQAIETYFGLIKYKFKN